MEKGTVLIVGSGGREHAISLQLAKSASVADIHVAPGNAGTSMVGSNHEVALEDIDGLCELAVRIGADLVIIGPEAPLVAGLADRLRQQGINCFGPNAEGALLEGSKQYAKSIMRRLGVPTAGSVMVTENSQIDSALGGFSKPWVIKRDGLAAGKGVTVTENIADARDAVKRAIETDGKVLIEEFLPGEEASILVLMDESGFSILPSSQDHKRLNDGDTGPNTGGMGAYAPAPVVTNMVMDRVISRIVEPMHEFLSGGSGPYRGCLYIGLMIDDCDPKVVEFNVRLGDPETQVTLPLVQSDLGLLFMAVSEGKLSDFKLDVSKKHAATIVLASEGYPDKPIKGRIVSGISFEEDGTAAIIHHAGTRLDGDLVVSSGGRVLSVTGISDTLEGAINGAYSRISKVSMEGGHYRQDIGHKALET
ncbi:MAG: phosphoribosylamine--glycine ligase [Candidatus Thermoplasmatota archaeon]|nr:phosphoribosylamine--glycine ligase [Candidatus Thermoplasmatota archaeon]|tara:strand:+ start:2092 stop:3354 length:1263 start_codon:yes stop_codon:yes gene_type:complete